MDKRKLGHLFAYALICAKRDRLAFVNAYSHIPDDPVVAETLAHIGQINQLEERLSAVGQNLFRLPDLRHWIQDPKIATLVFFVLWNASEERRAFAEATEGTKESNRALLDAFKFDRLRVKLFVTTKVPFYTALNV